MDETRELISLDDEENDNYLTYCFCMKSLCEVRERNVKFCICGGIASPFLFVADMVALVPQVIINNVKLCIR